MRHFRRSTDQSEMPARRAVSRGLLTGRDLCRFDSGFTLVELIITLVLFGIVSAIAVPSYRGWVDNSHLKGAARSISSDFYDARARATSENLQYQLRFNLDPTNTYELRLGPAFGAPIQTKNFAEYPNVRMTSVTGGEVMSRIVCNLV